MSAVLEATSVYAVLECTVGAVALEIPVQLSGFTGGSGGVSDGNKGDVTVSGGGLAWAVNSGAVTLAKMANLPAGTIIGNNTGAGATPIALTAAQVKTLLAIAAADVSGLGVLATLSSVNLTTQATGTLQAAQMPALTGDVTTTAGALGTTIAAGAVTLAKMANVATGTVFYRKTAATGAPEVQTLATLKADLGLTGTNSGDQTITLTSDVTGSGTGSFAATIAAGAVTLAKMANLAANSIIGNNTGAGATPIALTAAQVKTLLAIAAGDVSGLGALATVSSVSLTTQATGTMQAAQMPALTGDVTTTAGALGTTIAAGAVTLAKMANVATATFLGRTTAGTGAVEALTATQATALLNVASTTLKGLVPAPGTATGKVLDDSLSWVALAGGGDAVKAGLNVWTGTYNDFTTTVYLDHTEVFDGTIHGLNIANFADNSKTASFDASLITTSTARQYKLPDANGTLALLEKTQTWAGDNTFGGQSFFTAFSGFAAWTDMVAGVNGLHLYDPGTPTKVARLDVSALPAGTPQDFALPAIGGNLALQDYYAILTANYTLTSTTALQKAFNWSTNGALTLPVGYYRFETVIIVTGMSATSGNAQFDLKGAGGATLANIDYFREGAESSTPTTASAAFSGGASVISASPTSAFAAGTATGMTLRVAGVFQVTAAGTIIPSLGLNTAIAAVVNAGSYFRCAYIGASALTGPWS